MSLSEMDILKCFYTKLRASIQKIKKKPLKEQSTFIIFFDSTEKTVREILKCSGIPKYKIKDEMIFQQLCDKKYIKLGDKPAEYIITPKGIWEYEIENHLFSVNDFLDYFDRIYFQFLNQNQGRSIKSKDRVILFTLLAIRSFSKEIWINLNVNQDILNIWKEIFDKTQKKLFEIGVISQKESEDFWKKKKEDITDPVYDLLRHSGGLVLQTNDIYKFSGNKEYYLMLSNDPKLFREEIIFLFKKVLSNIEINTEIRENLSYFCNEISFNYSYRVFDKENEYANLEFDGKLREIILYM